jgi:hypothetical protein
VCDTLVIEIQFEKINENQPLGPLCASEMAHFVHLGSYLLRMGSGSVASKEDRRPVPSSVE